MQDFIEKFNRFFEERGKLEIEGKNLRITIGNETLVIQLPSIIGGESKATDD